MHARLTAGARGWASFEPASAVTCRLYIHQCLLACCTCNPACQQAAHACRQRDRPPLQPLLQPLNAVNGVAGAAHNTPVVPHEQISNVQFI